MRQELLSKYGIGLVSLGDKCLRMAFSSIDEDKITAVLEKIYETAERLADEDF